MNQLANSLKNPTALLHIIKYEVLHKKPIFESYKNMCKLIGDDVMTYPDFEFWYMKFYNGQLEMDYDRSEDKEPLALSELPVEIVTKVIEWLDPISRITTRQVSKVLRSIIDNQPLALKSLEFHPSDTLGIIQFGRNNQKIWYREKPEYILYTYKRPSEFEVDNPIKLSSIHFKSLTSNSKLKVETYVCSIGTEYRNLQDFVPRCRLSAQNLHIETPRSSFLKMILQKCEPGKLENIHIELQENNNDIFTVNDVYRMKQWKQAKIIEMLKWGVIDSAGLRHFYHFVEFSLKTTSVTKEMWISLRNNLLLSPTFQFCKIYVETGEVSINFGDGLEGVQQVDEQTICVPVPNSTDVLEFSVVDKKVRVERKTISD